MTIFGLTTNPNAAQELNRRQVNFNNWREKSVEKARTAKPKQFDAKTKWVDWKDPFVNFLRTQPGRNGVPLSYIVRDNDAPIVQLNEQFFDDYVNQAPLQGEVCASDASEVHIYIVSFITENLTAENKILPFQAQKDDRANFQTLKEHYEGVGTNARALVTAEENINNLFYSGEKKPTMWWEEFKTRLTVSYATVDKN